MNSKKVLSLLNKPAKSNFCVKFTPIKRFRKLDFQLEKYRQQRENKNDYYRNMVYKFRYNPLIAFGLFSAGFFYLNRTEELTDKLPITEETKAHLNAHNLEYLPLIYGFKFLSSPLSKSLFLSIIAAQAVNEFYFENKLRSQITSTLENYIDLTSIRKYTRNLYDREEWLKASLVALVAIEAKFNYLRYYPLKMNKSTRIVSALLIFHLVQRLTFTLNSTETTHSHLLMTETAVVNLTGAGLALVMFRQLKKFNFHIHTAPLFWLGVLNCLFVLTGLIFPRAEYNFHNIWLLRLSLL